MAHAARQWSASSEDKSPQLLEISWHVPFRIQQNLNKFFWEKDWEFLKLQNKLATSLAILSEILIKLNSSSDAYSWNFAHILRLAISQNRFSKLLTKNIYHWTNVQAYIEHLTETRQQPISPTSLAYFKDSHH